MTWICAECRREHLDDRLRCSGPIGAPHPTVDRRFPGSTVEDAEDARTSYAPPLSTPNPGAVRRLPVSHPAHQALAQAVLRLEADVARWSGFLRLDPDSPVTIMRGADGDILSEIAWMQTRYAQVYRAMLDYRDALNTRRQMP
jgi:hypothetical protein